MNERTDERIKSNSNSKWTNRNEQMANSFDVKFNRKKPIFCPTFSFLVGPLFFHALELSYVNEKVIMNLKRKKKRKDNLAGCSCPMSVHIQITLYGKLNLSEPVLRTIEPKWIMLECKQHVRDDWNTTVVRSILFELQIQHSPHNFFFIIFIIHSWFYRFLFHFVSLIKSCSIVNAPMPLGFGFFNSIWTPILLHAICHGIFGNIIKEFWFWVKHFEQT